MGPGSRFACPGTTAEKVALVLPPVQQSIGKISPALQFGCFFLLCRGVVVAGLAGAVVGGVALSVERLSCNRAS